MTINLQNFFNYFDETNPNHVESIKLLSQAIPNLLTPSSDWVITYRGKATQDPVILQNFFHYFSEKNPNHVNAIAQLQKELPTEQSQDSSPWVVKYREAPPIPTEIKLNVPFYNQLDNYRDPYRTCNSSSCAMCLEYLKPGTLIGPKGDDAYIQKVFAIGDTTDHEVQTKVLKSYGIDSSFSYTLGFDDLERELKAGRSVPIAILHRGTLQNPTGGHIVVAVGLTVKGDFYIHDPYGDLNGGYQGPVEDGKYTIYTREVLTYRWLNNGADKTGWGRIFKTNPPTNKITVQSTRVVGSSLVVPQAGVDLIKKFEGCSLKAYYDPASGGLPITIAYGATRRRDGSRFMIGNTVTQQEADDLLMYQLQTDYLPALQKIPYWNEMSDNKKSALLSFAYNLGANFYGSDGFNTITTVLKNKEWDKVPDALMLYVNPGSNVEAGLRNRRKAEGDIWKK
jgi:GH24 family phage-related lysozyme (muramidase)